MERNDEIKKYLRGNRKGISANRLEREALSDPFLFEALEGLTATPGDPMDGLIRLERQLEERARQSRKKKWGWLYVVASLLVLVLCGTLWYVQTQEQAGIPEIAQLHSAEPDVMLKYRARKNIMEVTKDSVGEGDSVRGKIIGIAARQQIKPLIGAKEIGVESMDITGADEVRSVMRDSISLASQERTKEANVLEGTVTDEKGEPLPGVSVLVAGKNLGTVTDRNGNFRLVLPGKKAHVAFTFIGMETQGMDVTAGERIVVKMRASQENLEEVVVTGHWDSKQMSMTCVISKIVDVDTLVSPKDVVQFNKYMEQALQYPKVDLEKNNEGVIKVSFELNKKTIPSRIRIKDGFSKESNKELIRLLSHGPKWENSSSGKRIHATVQFSIGRNGAKNKAVLSITAPEK